LGRGVWVGAGLWFLLTPSKKCRIDKSYTIKPLIINIKCII
jgi:hypothetical protein